MLDHNTVRRLAFIRYLYLTGAAQSRAPAPLNCASILTLHDSVELFFQLASERLNAGTAKTQFMEYWDILNERLDSGELEQRESMRRLNNARVALKHHGTLPSDLDIEAFRASTTAFFQGNTPIVFELTLDEVSLIEFVNPDSARAKLREAQDAIREGDVHAALDQIAIAFTEMIADYENRKRESYETSPFYFGRSLPLITSRSRGSGSVDKKVADFMDTVKTSLETMQDAMKILALGIDYRKYSKLKRLTPYAWRALTGDMKTQWPLRDLHAASAEDARFCIDFVVESALALSEFDYSVGSAV